MGRDIDDWDLVQQGIQQSPWSPKQDWSPASNEENQSQASSIDSNLFEAAGRRKTHRRSSTAVRIFDFAAVPEESPERKPVLVAGQSLESGLTSDMDTHPGASQKAIEESTENPRPRSTSPSLVSNPTSEDVKADPSESSSESGSTLTQASYVRRDSKPKSSSKTKKQPLDQTSALSFLDADSPDVTHETIQSSMQASVQASVQNSSPVHSAAPAQWSPTSATSNSPTSRSIRSSNSSSSRSDGSANGAGHDTDQSSSPERSPRGRMAASSATNPMDSARRRNRSYGTPEMPRGMANLPHMPPSALAPRTPGHTQGFPKHLPRAEKLPMTGYEKLASRLTQVSDRPGPYIKPMYRRFEMLNHRLLLHLQDELCELEEQLHRLDTADTQNRRLQNCILPASRRAEVLSGGELQWHRTDVLGKIGFKLEQYNNVLSSYQSTESLSKPTLADIHEYRGYLATHTPIAEIETQFLNAADDLVCFGPAAVDADDYDDYDEDTAATPMARHDFDFPVSRSAEQLPNPPASSSDGGDHEPEQLVPMGLAMAIAIVLPILTFNLGPLMVVFVVGLGTLGALVQARVSGVQGTRELCICACFYSVATAAIVGVCR